MAPGSAGSWDLPPGAVVEATLWERGPREEAVAGAVVERRFGSAGHARGPLIFGATLLDGRTLGVALRSQSLPSHHSTGQGMRR